MKLRKQLLNAVLVILLLPCLARGQDTKKVDPKTAQNLKKWEAQINEYKQWIDLVRADQYRFWVRLDGSHRPYRLYVGEGFDNADDVVKEEFVETFSRVLAGHPEKFMLIDLFDGATGTQIGEFGWGGFKLYSNYKAVHEGSLSSRR